MTEARSDIRAPDAAEHLPAVARLAGHAGWLPFLGALLTLLLSANTGLHALAVQLAVGWAALILAFVGAVHWGFALTGRWPWSWAMIAGSILPSAWALIALALGGERGLALLVAGFGLFWLYEHRWLGAALPPAYLRLRRELTLMVCTLLSLLAFATGQSSS